MRAHVGDTTSRRRMWIAVEDESIFIHDALIRRRMWTPEGKRPIVTVTGSHQRTCVFGTITIDGNRYRQAIRTYMYSQRLALMCHVFYCANCT